jgi:hypothetical protein
MITGVKSLAYFKTLDDSLKCPHNSGKTRLLVAISGRPLPTFTQPRQPRKSNKRLITWLTGTASEE